MIRKKIEVNYGNIIISINLSDEDIEMIAESVYNKIKELQDELNLIDNIVSNMTSEEIYRELENKDYVYHLEGKYSGYYILYDVLQIRAEILEEIKHLNCIADLKEQALSI